MFFTFSRSQETSSFLSPTLFLLSENRFFCTNTATKRGSRKLTSPAESGGHESRECYRGQGERWSLQEPAGARVGHPGIGPPTDTHHHLTGDGPCSPEPQQEGSVRASITTLNHKQVLTLERFLFNLRRTVTSRVQSREFPPWGQVK